VEGLAKAFDALSELQKVIKEDRQISIFRDLSKTMQKTGSHFSESGELIKLYCGSHLKYHLSETDSYQEMLAFRE
jgi:16S rRNA C1402 (ribose-2'-O) methylase RsmI